MIIYVAFKPYLFKQCPYLDNIKAEIDKRLYFWRLTQRNLPTQLWHPLFIMYCIKSSFVSVPECIYHLARIKWQVLYKSRWNAGAVEDVSFTAKLLSEQEMMNYKCL